MKRDSKWDSWTIWHILIVQWQEDNFMINAIGFNMGDLSEKYLIDDKVDVVGSIEINSFNGNESIQLILKDIRKAF